MPSHEEAADETQVISPRKALAITGGGILVLAALVLAIEPIRAGLGDAVTGDTQALRKDLRGLGFAGGLIVLALALAHSVVWYPAEILNAAAGFVYGFGVALPLLMAGWLLNAIICHQIGRHAARPFLCRWLGGERFSRYEEAVGRGGVTLLIGMRLVPIVPFSLFSYAAGSARVPAGRYLWTTAVGYLPLTAAFVYFGSRLEQLSLEDPVLWAAVAVVIALLLLTRRLARSVGLGDAGRDSPPPYPQAGP